jgi:hypothetical protein
MNYEDYIAKLEKPLFRAPNKKRPRYIREGRVPRWRRKAEIRSDKEFANDTRQLIKLLSRKYGTSEMAVEIAFFSIFRGVEISTINGTGNDAGGLNPDGTKMIYRGFLNNETE